MNYLQNQPVNKIFLAVALVLILIALPLTVFLVRHQTDSRSHAAAPDKLEAEGGVLGGNATLKSDSAASGGQYVLFSIPNSTPTPSPTPISAPVTNKLGVAAHLMWGGIPNPRSQQTAWMQAGGMKWVRFDVGWRWIEPTKGNFDQNYLTKLDATLADLDSKGIRPIVVMVETPAWANGNQSIFTPPTDMQDYANVFGYLANRYKNRPGMIWEVWNEPNLINFWATGPNAAAYTNMLKAAYTSIKANDPDATVLGGSLVFDASAFLDQMYANGAKNYFDALSIHPYGFSLPPTDSGQYGVRGIVERMKADLDAHGDSSKKIYITEVGWKDKTATGKSTDPTDSQRAAYFTDLAALVNNWSFVEALTAYVLTKSTNAEDATIGLIGNDAADTSHTGPGIPTSTWTAYSSAAKK